jgi:uncharacterized protein (DUF885 family)
MYCKAVYSHPGFRKISEHYYSELLSRNPITATWLGEHDFDGLLPESGAEAVERNLAFLREMRDAFASIPESELSIDEQLDREIAIHFASSQIFLDEDLHRWKMGKDLAMNIGDSLFLLYTRDFAPLHERVQSIIMRLKAVPMYLMGSKTLFQKVPPLWGEIFLESLGLLPEFIQTIEKSVQRHISPILHQELEKAANQAKRSIAEFRNWFTHAIMPKADHDWAMGDSAFDAFIATKKLGLSRKELLDFANKAAQQARIQLDMLTQRILGKTTGKSPSARKEALKKIRRNCPKTFEMTLDAYKEAMKRCRDFVQTSDFATLPENEGLEIIETPQFMSHLIPFSAYIGPERTASKQKGMYLLTRSKHPSDLQRSNFAEISNAALHEGYPGHHLQLTGQNLHPGKFRIFADCLEMIEGWSHYCENELADKGFYKTDAEKFTLALDQLFNAARLCADVNLQCRTWTFEQALHYLMEETGIDKNSAIAELKRYSQTPGCQISYTIGNEMLQDIKLSLKNEFKTDFSDKNFHDLVIYQGSIPVFMARKYYPRLFKANLKADSRT